jgi:long-chain acyl-CoA synthetase
VVACIVSRDGAPIAADELDAVCLAHVARFKRPRAYVMFPELPKNETGKVLKTRLREAVSR